MNERDEEVLKAVLRVDEVPDKVCSEYARWHRLYCSMGGSGPLGPAMLVPMLRQLKVEQPAEKRPESINWRNEVGNQIEARYGDSLRVGILDGLAPDGGLYVRLRDIEGVIELPRHMVSLPDPA